MWSRSGVFDKFLWWEHIRNSSAPKLGRSQLQQSKLSNKDFYTENVPLVFDPKCDKQWICEGIQHVWWKSAEAVWCLRELDQLEVGAGPWLLQLLLVVSQLKRGLSALKVSLIITPSINLLWFRRSSNNKEDPQLGDSGGPHGDPAVWGHSNTHARVWMVQRREKVKSETRHPTNTADSTLKGLRFVVRLRRTHDRFTF